MPLALSDISAATACIRTTFASQPAAGPEAKLFPTTYNDDSKAVHAFEERRGQDGQRHTCVVVDSEQSQANRMEEAVIEARRQGRLSFPDLAVDFDGVQGTEATMLYATELPHRCYDAILRDGLYKGIPFKDSPAGKRLLAASRTNATPLLEISPFSLVFGAWASQHGAVGRDARFERTVIANITGIDAVLGVATASRRDPLGLRKMAIYQHPDGAYTPYEDEAVKDGSSAKPRKFRQDKTADLNHGNVTPSIDVAKGGVTVRECRHTFVLNVAAMRRLQFPDADGVISDDRNLAAIRLLSALGLAAFTLMHERGYALRSRCLLIPVVDRPEFELLTTASQATTFSLGSTEALALVEEAIEGIKAAKFSWDPDPVVFAPGRALRDLIRRSRELDLRDAAAEE